ncbi:hypothetical protein FSP39_003894 [Pinctada imbricata]|uniref:EF-hand domain-containing protein n=1 Tax=Pinctada imbricata TaxID=66713 RepID=A0AA88YH92_PINIB|nr:hypothetical protein FSP39_003894 [Pinctada imbricata]
MSFMVNGTPTPRNMERNLPGSARHRPGSGRPPSAKPMVNRNPITGIETPIRTESRTGDRPQSRPAGVPALNLKAFQGEDRVVGVPVELGEYPLHTPNTASTVSWGTPCSTARNESYRPSNRTPKPQSSKSSRPDGVPGLYFGYSDEPQQKHKAAKQKEPSAWDKAPCPDDLPPPSQRYKDMYKEYDSDMKNAYKHHTGAKYVTKDDIDYEVEAVKKSHPVTYGEVRDEVDREQYSDEEDLLDKNWAKKQSYSTTQMLKKMDAEDLLEYNKQQKLIETVMIDQLSRAVISDPEQNTRAPVSADTRRLRGTNRYLHDSKVRTTATTTENLLSKRVRFGARILTRDGHDALRELTGFFFEIDNTMTIYEFRQFGKSAKALPLIGRGKYCHIQGPKKGEPYSLVDIHSGADILISTTGQHSLPDTARKSPVIRFRVTDLDEEAKQAFLLQDVRPSARGDMYAHLHMQNKQEHRNKLTIASVQAEVQKKLMKRGIKTYTGLGRYYRKLDDTNTGILYRFELEKGLFTYRIELPPELLDAVFEALDTEEEGELDYSVYMRGVIGEMNEYRKTLVRKAFRKIDSQKRGKVTISDIKKYFNASFRPPPNAGTTQDSNNPLTAFLDSVTTSPSQETVSYVEFEEYYEGLSLCIERDEDYANILHSTWNI